MTDEAMSPLRRRMIEDMTIRKFAPKSQHVLPRERLVLWHKCEVPRCPLYRRFSGQKRK